MVYIPEDGPRHAVHFLAGGLRAWTAASAPPRSRASTATSRAAEIVGQVFLAQKELGFQAGDDRLISNVVLMGMGEPLANFRNVRAGHAHPAR